MEGVREGFSVSTDPKQRKSTENPSIPFPNNFKSILIVYFNQIFVTFVLFLPVVGILWAHKIPLKRFGTVMGGFFWKYRP